MKLSVNTVCPRSSDPFYIVTYYKMGHYFLDKQFDKIIVTTIHKINKLLLLLYVKLPGPQHILCVQEVVMNSI